MIGGIIKFFALCIKAVVHILVLPLKGLKFVFNGLKLAKWAVIPVAIAALFGYAGKRGAESSGDNPA